MKKAWIAVSLFLAATCSATDTSLLPKRIDDAARQCVESGEYPVIVIGMIDGDRSEVHVYGKLDHNAKPDGKTLFEIGSVTKTFTATLLAEEVSDGKLKLSTPVALLLPDFTIPSLADKQITVGSLASQSSGLPRLPDNLKPVDAKDPYAEYDAGKLKAFLASYSLTRDPGASYEYSNLGVGLLGYALSAHAGTDYETLLQRKILKPLGMNHSTTRLGNAAHARLAPGHDIADTPVPNWHMAVLVGAGGIISSADDMLRYLKANMGLLETNLYPAMQLAQAPSPYGPRRPAGQLGLAWMIEHANGGDLIEHNGMTGGYASYVGFTADRKRGVVVLTNKALAVDNLGQAALLPGIALAPVHKHVGMSEHELDEYAGRYELMPGFVLTVSRSDTHLKAQATGQGTFPVYPSAKDEFFTNATDISLSFKRDAQGKINGLVVHQKGDHPARRLAPGES